MFSVYIPAYCLLLAWRMHVEIFTMLVFVSFHSCVEIMCSSWERAFFLTLLFYYTSICYDKKCLVCIVQFTVQYLPTEEAIRCSKGSTITSPITLCVLLRVWTYHPWIQQIRKSNPIQKRSVVFFTTLRHGGINDTSDFLDWNSWSAASFLSSLRTEVIFNLCT